jgi:hypothetical protein
MLKSIHNNQAIMDLTLSQIGLMLATAILLTTVISFISYNDWQRNMELKTVASQLSTLVEAMDAKSLENTTTYYLPDYGYDYTVTVSTEYVTVSAKGFWNNELSVKERFIVKPWPQDEDNNPGWIGTTGTTGLHEYLNTNYEAQGTLSDPVFDIVTVKDELIAKRAEVTPLFAQTHLELTPGKPVFIDKAVIYYGLPADFEYTHLGNDWTYKEGDVLAKPDGSPEYAVLGQAVPPWTQEGFVYYDFEIPHYSSESLSMYIRFEWKDVGSWVLGANGVQLSIYKWDTSEYIELIPNIGDSDTLVTTRQHISNPQAYIQPGTNIVRIKFDTNGEGLKDESWIHNVCLELHTPTTSISESQSFVLIHQ